MAISIDPSAKTPGRVRRNWNRTIKGAVASTLDLLPPLLTDASNQIGLSLTTAGGLQVTSNAMGIKLTASSGLLLSASGLSVAVDAAKGLSISAGTVTLATASASQIGVLSSADWSAFNGKQPLITGATALTAGALTLSGLCIASFFQTSTAVTANSSGTVSIVAKDAGVATPNAGWLPFKKSDGTTVYMPYWT